MKYLIFTISCLIGFVSCQQETNNHEPKKEVTKKEKVKSNYLEFDEIVYYHHSTLSWDSWVNYAKKEDDKLLNKIAFNMYPEVEEMKHVKDFERIGYEKMVLEGHQFKAIKAITTDYKYSWRKHKSEQKNVQSNIINKKILSEILILKYLEQISSVFNNHFLFFSNAKKDDVCMKIFRDILVFKKDGQNVGMSKICYECTGDRTVTVNDKWLHIDEMLIAEVLNIDTRRR